MAHTFSFEEGMGYSNGNIIVSALRSRGVDGACTVPHYLSPMTQITVLCDGERDEALRLLQRGADDALRESERIVAALRSQMERAAATTAPAPGAPPA